MWNHSPQYHRILAIDPSTKGFGFAVLEGNDRLVDWGVAGLWSKSDEEFLTRLEAMVDRYCPPIIAVEDTSSMRRGDRAQRRIDRVIGYARLRNILPVLVSRREVRSALGLSDRATKHEVAAAITRLLPELETSLPPLRKPWMSEDERMNLFDAVALALVAADGHNLLAAS